MSGYCVAGGKNRLINSMRVVCFYILHIMCSYHLIFISAPSGDTTKEWYVVINQLHTILIYACFDEFLTGFAFYGVIYTLRTRLETLVTVDSCRYP